MRRNSKRPPLHLDIAPVNLIDLLLVLLIFFITTTTFLQLKVIELNIPHAKSSQPIASTQKSVTINIKENCDFYIDSAKVEKDRLSTTIKELYQEDPKRAFQIGADENSAHKCFVTILDILQKNKIENISILTKTRE